MLTTERHNPRTISRSFEWLKIALPPALVFVVVLVLWQTQVIHALLNIRTFQLPVPSQIINSFTERGRDLWTGTWYTLGEALIGLALGSSLGFISAALFAQFDFLRRGF